VASQSPSLNQVRGALPPEVMTPSVAGALGTIALVLAVNAAAGALAVWTWRNPHWWTLPFSWLASGAAFTSLFVLGHDCAHGSFFASKRLNAALGHVALFVPGYPFHAWRITHDAHHAFTNRLDHPDPRGEGGVYFDNAWRPLTTRQWAVQPASLRRIYYVARRVLGFGSFVHLVVLHFSPSRFKRRHRADVRFSIAFFLAAAAATTGALWARFGSPLAVLHFWILPALFFQPFIGTYTFLHHASENVPYWKGNDWSPYAGQVLGTLNVLLPNWLSFVHLRIDFHVPHHVSTRIPCYRLRDAHAALLTSPYAPRIRTLPFSWGYLFQQKQVCRLWDPQRRAYVDFPSDRHQPVPNEGVAES
jgi:omega-6 fatty acid desaturase (delta-12 desaturase)